MPIPVTMGLFLVGLLYLRGWRRLSKVSPDATRRWRAAAFCCGLLSVWLAVGSPLAMLDEELLTAHMAQHLLLMTVGSPLILLGSPVLPLRHGFPKLLVRIFADRLFRLAPMTRLGRFLANPVFCWFAAAAVLIGWHIPAAFDLARGSELWHHFQQSTFLTAGLLFWWPVIPSWPGGPHPRWSIVLYLFLATLPCDGLSAFLAFCGRVVYSSYLNAPRRFSLSPLQDQQCAGALMWTCVTIIYLIPATLITMRLLSSSEIHDQPEEADSTFTKLIPDVRINPVTHGCDSHPDQS
jgi:putative membrane protein